MRGGRKKILRDRCVFVGRQKLCFAKLKLSITMQSEVRRPSWPLRSHRHPAPIPLPSFLPLASRPFSSFSRLLGPPARRNAASSLIKSSLSVTPLAHSLAPSKAGLSVVVAVGGGSAASARMMRPLKSRPASRLPLMRSIQPIQRSGRAASSAWNARPPSLAALLRCY